MGRARASTPSPERVRGCSVPLAGALSSTRAARAAGVFRALADPTRVQIVHLLRASPDPVCICDFTACFSLSQPTVSHHMSRLRAAGLVTSSKRGIWTFYRLNPDLAEDVEAALAAVP